ncbi:hypothetical protein [Halorubellus sp. PRR65]|uniref:hypothetical protein n=1 Tax=Halorubellus sp. PRR65 TaxID=3098148 RepID=UPI002B258F35|nr:hypothetical protein [Halorubellus sp. PRR65]
MLHWCTCVSLPPRGANPGEEREQLHPDIGSLDGTLRVDGRRVGAVGDVIRPGSGPAFAFWNITDPLAEGTHEAEFRLTVPSDCSGSPPARMGVAGELSVDWEPGKTVSLSRTIVAAPPADVPTRRDVDPLWGRRDVRYVTAERDGEDEGVETVEFRSVS